MLSLSTAVVVSLAFSEYLTRTALGVAAFWPANALLAAGLITLNGSRGLALSIVFVVFHLAVDLLVGDSPPRALLYTAIDTGEALAVWGISLRFWRGAPRIRTL
ncbi:MAG TPA: MASE1 domain-containing protein, partial [Caulobacter sp.]|nr:MASE1 domain-containing protein [Caulobacter sp.]